MYSYSQMCEYFEIEELADVGDEVVAYVELLQVDAHLTAAQ